jgi:hypothetical protein
MRLATLFVVVGAVASGCTSGGGQGGSAPQGRSRTTDSRVAPLRGLPPHEFSGDVRWLNAPATTLAALRGKVVFLQFAFPT